MRQSNNPMELLQSLRTRAGMTGTAPPSSVSNDQRIQVMNTQSKNSAWSLSKKKALAKKIKLLATEIKKDINDNDTISRTDIPTKFAEIETQYNSNKKINDMNNAGHSNLLVNFLAMAEVIFQQKKETVLQSRRHTRSVTEGDQFTSDVDQLYKECGELLKLVDTAARKKMDREENGTNKLLDGLPLEAAMIGRTYDPLRKPQDSANEECPWCCHRNVMTVEEDDDATVYNANEQRKFEEADKVWTDFEKARDEANNRGDAPPRFPTNPHTGKEMKRKPQKPGKNNLKSPRLLCPCVTSTCQREGTDEGTTCPMKCCKVGEGGASERYVWEFRGALKVCTCPVCQCPCNKLFHVSDRQRIALALIQRAGQIGNTISGAEQTSQFIAQAFVAGHQAVSDASAVSRANAWGNVDTDPQMQRDIFYAGAAGLVVRQGENLLDSNGIQHLQRNCGRVTDVTLPSGDRFDTNRITNNQNAHARNNRMNGSLNRTGTASTQIPPGMTSQLEIDYSRLSRPFQQAALNPNNTSSAIQGICNQIGASINTSAAVSASSHRNNLPPAASSASAAAAASSASAAAAAASHDETFASSMDQFVLQGVSEEEQIRKAIEASAHAQKPDHGGKLSPQPQQQDQSDMIDLCDDTTPSPPLGHVGTAQHPSTMSTMGMTTTLDQGDGGSTTRLLSTFNAAGSQGSTHDAAGSQGTSHDAAGSQGTTHDGSTMSAAQRNVIRGEVAQRMWNNVENANAQQMHTDTPKDKLTTPQRKERNAAKKRRKQLEAVEEGGDRAIMRKARELIGRNEPTLSQGGPSLTPNTLLNRFDNAQSDSEEDLD